MSSAGDATATPSAPKAAAKPNALLRQLQAIKRQPSAPKAPSAPSQVTPLAKAVEADKADGNSTTSAAPASGKVQVPVRLRADGKSSVQIISPKDAAARRLGLPLKGSVAARDFTAGALWKRSVKISGSPAAAVGIAGAGSFAKRSMRTSVLATAARAAAAASGARTAPDRAKARPMLRSAAQVPPVLRVARGAESRSSLRAAPRLRGTVRHDMGRAFAAAAARATGGNRPQGAPKARVRLGAAVRPAVRLTGVAGALLAVKREEDSSVRQQRGVASKVTTRQPRAAPAGGGAQLRPAAQSGAAGGFGYGDCSDDSDESRQEPAENGLRPRSRQHAPLPAPARVPTEKRNRNLISGLMGHLASAKRQLSDEGGFRGGMRVKEEPRWKPEDSPARESAGADDAAREESADEEEAQSSPPRKRAKLSDVKLSGKNSKRQQAAKEAEQAVKAEAKEMQNLQKRLEFHYSSMKNFIRTRAEPTIFYLPKKHNSESKRQLEETRTAIGQKISSLKVHLQSTAASDDEEDDNDGGSN